VCITFVSHLLLFAEKLNACLASGECEENVIEYLDMIDWQKELRETGAFKEASLFWKKQYATIYPKLLPFTQKTVSKAFSKVIRKDILKDKTISFLFASWYRYYQRFFKETIEQFLNGYISFLNNPNHIEKKSISKGELVPLPSDETVVSWFEKPSVQFMDNSAYRSEKTTLSYVQLNEKANQFARHLLDVYLIKQNERVVIQLSHSEQLIISFLAVLKLGATYIPVDVDSLEGRVGEHRLYKTGDLGRCLPNGEIEYLGRIDHQVKLNGYRIELGEIESTLNQHPSVKELCVTVFEKENDKHLVAYICSDDVNIKQLKHDISKTLQWSN